MRVVVIAPVLSAPADSRYVGTGAARALIVAGLAEGVGIMNAYGRQVGGDGATYPKAFRFQFDTADADSADAARRLIAAVVYAGTGSDLPARWWPVG